jgi:hypothetical protein
VDVIGHQARPKLRHRRAVRPRRPTPIKAIVVGPEKHGLAPIAALADMVRQVWHNNRAIRAMPALAPADLPMFIAAWAQSCKLSP